MDCDICWLQPIRSYSEQVLKLDKQIAGNIYWPFLTMNEA